MKDEPVMRLGADGVMRLEKARVEVRDILEKAHADAGVATNPKTANDFYDAFTRMVAAFEEREGRKPNENDDNFLSAAIELYERFFGGDGGKAKPVQKSSGAARDALSGRRIVLGAASAMAKAAHEPVSAGPTPNRRLVMTGRGD